VGANGTTLVADSSQATGLKWQAASGSGLTLISRTTFSNQSTQAFDSVFTSTYTSYTVTIENLLASTPADDFQIQMRYAGPTTETGTVYNGNTLTTSRENTTTTNTAYKDANPFTIAPVTGATGNSSSYNINFSGVGNTAEVARFNGAGFFGENVYGASFFACGVFQSTLYTGFLLKSSSSNISGVVTIYGLAKS
jgi:hypothetical protein